MNITIYSTPTCPYCVMAKNYFKQKNVNFSDYDVSRNQSKAEEMIRLSGQSGVPVININGNIIRGFDRQAIDRLIN